MWLVSIVSHSAECSWWLHICFQSIQTFAVHRRFEIYATSENSPVLVFSGGYRDGISHWQMSHQKDQESSRVYNYRMEKALNFGKRGRTISILVFYRPKEWSIPKWKKNFKESISSVKKFAETILNGGNITKGIIIWTNFLLRYSAEFLDWNNTEFEKIDWRTRTLMNMHKSMNSNNNVDGLYIPRKERSIFLGVFKMWHRLFWDLRIMLIFHRNCFWQLPEEWVGIWKSNMICQWL